MQPHEWRAMDIRTPDDTVFHTVKNMTSQRISRMFKHEANVVEETATRKQDLQGYRGVRAGLGMRADPKVREQGPGDRDWLCRRRVAELKNGDGLV